VKKCVFNIKDILLNFNKEMELSCKSLGREFYAVGAEKPKLRLPNVFVRTRGISSWHDVEDRRKAQEGSTENRLYVGEEVFGGQGM